MSSHAAWDPLAEHFAWTLKHSIRAFEHAAQSRRVPSSHSRLEESFNSVLSFSTMLEQQPPLGATSSPSTRRSPRQRQSSTRPTRLESVPLGAAVGPRTVRRNSWADPRSQHHRRELDRHSDKSGSDTDDGDDESDGPFSKAKIDSFPPRRPPIRPIHRRVRSDPGPTSSAASHKRDLRRTLLKRRATLSQQSAAPPRPVPAPIEISPSTRAPPPSAHRSRRSIEMAQALRMKTFNFPSTTTSPFLSTPSSSSSFSSSANSVRSRFSDDSSSSSSSASSDEDESDACTSESESDDDEEREHDGRKSKMNAFDLELDLFPQPPSPSRAS
ncbi:hypothetical protein JCM3766R1_005925 [Sporobolomyces carnicolor]